MTLVVTIAAGTVPFAGPHSAEASSSTVLVEADRIALTGDDVVATATPIGFNFPFFGVDRTEFRKTTNGVVGFGTTTSTFTNTALPATGFDPAIFALWDDLHPVPGSVNPDISGTSLTQQLSPGDAGNGCPATEQVRIVQWTNYGFFSDPSVLGTFQVHLCSGGTIILNYVLLSSDRARGNSATVGVQPASTDGAGVTEQVFFYTSGSAQPLASRTAIVFTPKATATDGYIVDVNTPTADAPTVSRAENFVDVLLYDTSAGLPPAQPAGPSPASGASAAPTALTWTGETDASRITDYRVQLWEGSRSGTRIFDVAVTSPTASLGSFTLQVGTTYVWEVTARGPGGNTFSPLWQFTATEPPPAPPSSPAPEPIPDPSGALPATPPGVTTGSVGGVPTVPTPARPNAGTAEFRVGTVEARVDVAVGGAGTVGGTGSAPVIRTVRDRVAQLTGGGMQPGGIAEVWLPLPDGGSRQVALLPIAADGTFDGALPFTGELDGRGPLPIGDRTIQLFGVGADGQLTVVNFGVRIEQPGPLTPEPDRGQGAPPALSPGQSLATNAGVPTPVTVTPLPDASSTRIEGSDWLMEVDIPEGSVRDAGGAPLIEIVNGEDSVVRGTGFMPGTRAYVWLMSDPTFLGEVTVGADGTFSGTVPVDGVEVGEHTLQLSGVGTDGYVRAANLGVVLVGDGMPVPTRVPAGDGPIGGATLPVMLLALALAGAGVAVRGRRVQRRSVGV